MNSEEATDFCFESVRAATDMIRSTLGPRGLDKMLVNGSGSVTVTNDGATILRETQFDNPVVDLFAEVAGAQDVEASDGTTSATVLAGALLNRAQSLIERGVHPSAVFRGYRHGFATVDDHLTELATPVHDEPGLARAAVNTCLTSRVTGDVATAVTDTIVEAVDSVTVADDDGRETADPGRVRTVTPTGIATRETESVEGIVIEAEPLRRDVPATLPSARLLLIDAPLDDTSSDGTSVEVSDHAGKTRLTTDETERLRRQADRVQATGADVVLSGDSVPPAVATALANGGVYAFENVDRAVLSFAKTALDATICTDPESVS
ncbi:MAG: chaperonin GroEL (HSP60 family), partial [uncultured archaeon A07HB70]